MSTPQHTSLIKEALEILKTREFVAVASAEKGGKPNSAPKFLLKIVGRIIYFIDYSIGKTAENLKTNPEVSLSFIDMDTLVGYRLNGKVEIVEKGMIYDDCLRELQEKTTNLTVERIIKGVHRGKSHKVFELAIPERFLVYKVKIEEGSEISPLGVIKRESGE